MYMVYRLSSLNISYGAYTIITLSISMYKYTSMYLSTYLLVHVCSHNYSICTMNFFVSICRIQFLIFYSLFLSIPHSFSISIYLYNVSLSVRFSLSNAFLPPTFSPPPFGFCFFFTKKKKEKATSLLILYIKLYTNTLFELVAYIFPNSLTFFHTHTFLCIYNIFRIRIRIFCHFIILL